MVGQFRDEANQLSCVANTVQLSGVETPGNASAALTVVQKVEGPLSS
ncbi:MAG: hypothetical protein ACRD0C_03045 [Acidimicrobiia bacterium]